MLMSYAKILGFIFLVVGFLGFVPPLAPDGMLFGLFMVNAVHNIVHILTGILLVAVGYSANWDLTRKVVLAFAIIYGLVTVVGFFQPEGAMFMGMPLNMADNILHLVVTVSALLVALPQRTPIAR